MNALQYETSPYLIQHADDPVEWYPWNRETLTRAQEEHLPILVSIGFSSCHWCHVMARESFQDPEIAAYMNAHFLNIKMDREEHPDLDALYMNACQVIAGTAGWPLQVFLTPDLKPFFAGTYFPPEPDGKRMSWWQALQYAHYNFQHHRAAVEQEAERVLSRMKRESILSSEAGMSELASSPQIQQLFQRLQSDFDREAGGFGQGQKFPNTVALEFLLNYFYYYRDPEALRHFRFTLSSLLKSGLYDQIGGGIARYATDRYWRIPHFEKMLYDNALFIQLLARAYRFIGRRKYKTAMGQCLDFLEREMRDPEGGFYAALDADSAGEEGGYYTWKKSEIDAVLGQQAALFCAYFGITETGNWEGTNILYQPLERFEYADQLGREREELLESMHAARRKLLAVRAGRRSLHRDKKIILAWNALVVSAYVQAYWATGQVRYRESAEQLLAFLWTRFRPIGEKNLFRVLTAGTLTVPATLRDYAFLIRAILDVFGISHDLPLLQRAEQLTDYVLDHFLAAESPLFTFSQVDRSDLVFRSQDFLDDEMPSGNTVMVRNLRELSLLLDRKAYATQAGKMLRQMARKVSVQPLFYAGWANNLLADAQGILEVAVVGEQAENWQRELQAGYIPFYITMAARQADDRFPLLRGKSSGGQTGIFVCRDQVCFPPLASPRSFADQYFKPPDLSKSR